MAHVITVIDSRTVVVESNGSRSTVFLSGVAIDASEETAAAAFLHQLVDRTWVYVEGGNVYRSPDGLYVNGEMQRHAWRTVPGMRYLGQSIAGAPRVESAAPTPTRVRARAGKSRTPTGAKRRKAPKAKGTS